jgi:hypothetical protein
MSHRTKISWTIFALLACVIAGRAWLGWRSQPQLPANQEVFKTVDGLFTAVTAHDEKRLALCEQRLVAYQQRGALPPAAFKRLQGVIATARQGEWETAARRLYDFMHNQRRATTS